MATMARVRHRYKREKFTGKNNDTDLSIMIGSIHHMKWLISD